MLKRRSIAVLVVAMVTGLAAAVAVAGVSAAPARTHVRQARLNVGVQVLRFSAAGRKTTARGLVTATLTDNRGHKSTIHDVVALTASTGGTCRVLHLFLNQLNLQLLGLTAHLDKVTLDITGDARGGVLGSLFCKLARAKVASARVAAARALTAGVRRHQGEVVRFTTYLSPRVTASAAANPTCQVLDLVVGPLNLQLLGLVVNLQKVHLSVTATRGGGALGDLFCQLADNNPTTTTSTTSG
jgi:hypothetical protein